MESRLERPFKMGDKKVIHVIEKYFFPVTAGIEVNMHETYKYLSKDGWQITFHTSKDTLTEKNILPDTEVISDMSVRRYKYGLFGYFPVIDWDRSDFICLHNFNVFPHFLILIYSLFKKITGKKSFKLILTPHGGFTPEWSVFPLNARVLKYIYHFTLGTLLINLVVDGVRAVSKWEQAEIIKKGVHQKKVRVIENGLEDEAFIDTELLASPDIKTKVEGFGRYIIQIGRVYPIKNLETTIRALKKLPNDINYVVAGPIELNHYAHYYDFLQNLIKSLDLQNRVFFIGVIKGVDKYYLIKKSLLMVHMALWESFCNVVHEGMSQGKVCVVANNTALPLLIQDGVNGYLVDTKDSEGLALKLQYILLKENKDEITKIELQSRTDGLKNSWREVATRVKEMYCSL